MRKYRVTYAALLVSSLVAARWLAVSVRLLHMQPRRRRPRSIRSGGIQVQFRSHGCRSDRSTGEYQHMEPVQRKHIVIHT